MRRIFCLLAALVVASACKRKQESAGPPHVVPSPATLKSARVQALPEQKLSLFPTAKLVLPDRSVIFVEVADTPESRDAGLMFRKELARDAGMLFVFPNAGLRQFWMKNTFVDLDMVWISGGKRITVICGNVPKSRADTPEDAVARRSGIGKYVLEMPAGAALRHKLKVSDAIQFDWKDPAK
ncbi:MAG: DUF192 domain-containing protein [Elusimicrobia bacterium]|nr:DUF192 domain-containing protein [Elusimicrobiota bacterium]